MANADFQNIGKAFTDHYYNTFDGPGGNGSTCANLQGLYQDSSMCTWDGKQMMGMVAIMTELTSFQTRAAPPIGTLQHKVIKCDCQPITTGSGILVQIIGDMCVNGDGVNLIKFSHTFALLPTAAGSWFISNEIFRTAGNNTINPPNAADKSDVGDAFTKHYYTTFDTARVNLQTLYQDTSLLSFEDDQFMGMSSIMTKLTTLQFQQVQHAAATCDCHPFQSGILIQVVGDLAVDGETTKPLKYVQSFVLMPTAAGSWFICHDVFRLNIG